MLIKLNITRKRTNVYSRDMNTSDIKDKRILKMQEIIGRKNDGMKFIYIDESPFKTHLNPTYGYSPAN